MRRPMENNSQEGNPVYDPFLGSGSSIVAAEQVGRIVLGLEIDPKYVDTAIRRWQAHTGGHAVHAVTGGSFTEIAELRAGAGATGRAEPESAGLPTASADQEAADAG